MKKVVLITGVSSGFGHAIARLLAGMGHIVYGTSRSGQTSIEGVRVLVANVNYTQEVVSVVQEVVMRESRLDVLINNAGFGIAGAIEDFSDEESMLELNTNFLGVHRCCQAVLPYMRNQGKGTIITIGSIAGIMGIPFQGFYSASKFALEGYMQALQYELQPYGVKVVMVNPGDFTTGFTANRIFVGAAANSHYSHRFRQALEVIEKDETNGLNPEVIARKVSAIVSAKKPRFRYIVASFDQKLAVCLSKILPGRLFFKIIAGHYRV